MPDNLKFGMYVFDFDKTITNKHTRGAVFIPSQAEPDELRKNFADLEFFRLHRFSIALDLYFPSIALHRLRD